MRVRALICNFSNQNSFITGCSVTFQPFNILYICFIPINVIKNITCIHLVIYLCMIKLANDKQSSTMEDSV